jgi:hypothetical protein
MAGIRVIPGAIGRDWARALVLVDHVASAVEPRVHLKTLAGDDAYECQVEPVVPVSASFREALGSLRAYLARSVGLPHRRFRFHARHQAGVTRSGPLQLIPPTADEPLKLLLASCFYQGTGRGGRYEEMAKSTYCQDAHLRVLLGDNVYFDVKPRMHWLPPFPPPQGPDADVVDKYRDYWMGADGYGEALADKPSLATYDDHEFWNDYPEKPHVGLGFWFHARRNAFERATRGGVDYFQHPLNPPGWVGSRSFGFEESPLVSVFVLDVRSQRDLVTGADSEMVPESMIDRLRAWSLSLQQLGKPGVLVLGQPLWIPAGGSADKTPREFADQYARIWHILATAPYDILVLSGDVHHSRALRVEVPVQAIVGGDTIRTPIHEIVSSPASVVWNPLPGGSGYEVPRYISTRISGTNRSRRLELGAFFFGAKSKQTLGTVTFSRERPGVVRVGVTFVSGDRARIEPARNAAPPGITPVLPVGAYCHATQLFSLGPRPRMQRPEDVQ